MKKRILFVVLCVIVPLAITSCDLISSLFYPPVSISEAREAFQAYGAFSAAGYTNTTIRADNGSNPNYVKAVDSTGTLTLEVTTTNGYYPVTYVITGKGFFEGNTGYSFSGKLTETDNSSTYATLQHNLDLSHGSKPVQKLTGTLTYSGGSWNGSLKFNNDSYDLTELY